jgi:dipeptidyl aminopeptidase/acylaminoacyl peptidase
MRLTAILTIALAGMALADPPPRTAPPTIETFASRPAVEGVAISPDGRYLATIQTQAGKGRVWVSERIAERFEGGRVLLAEPEHFRVSWCRFASNTRLLCSFRGMGASGRGVIAATRLVAVDADGRNMKVLVQDSGVAQGQFQDRVLHWHPGIADTVLIEADEGLIGGIQQSPDSIVFGNVGTHGLPAVFELNVVTGVLHIRQRAREPIRHWIVDARGQVRLGWGQEGATQSYYARLDGDSQWRRLAKFEIFTRHHSLEPIAITSGDPNKAYAIGGSGGRDALWLMDLKDNDDPLLVFADPSVDVDTPVRGRDAQLIGVYYETVYPNVFYLDGRAQEVAAAVRKASGGQFTIIVDRTEDENLYVLRSESDVAPNTFSVLDMRNGRLTRIGGPQQGLNPAELSPLETISYAARDGVTVPGYLTLPRGERKDHLPLVVMPHGGPIHRDGWHYDFLREFLASRGYAVLQMNFRGSGGYGADWFYAAHQDWGGKTYEDVVDGTKWAIAQGIADPQRVAILGWSFGGYVALVGAQRNADLFRCAISIAGLSDLGMLISEESRYMNMAQVVQKQIGTDKEKIRRDSPRLHTSEVTIPVLLIHGDRDAQVDLEQSQSMDAALTRSGKPHRFVMIKDADHQMSAESARVTLLHEIETFLGAHVPVGKAQ